MPDRFDEMARDLMPEDCDERCGSACPDCRGAGVNKTRLAIAAALRRVADEENEACAAIADPQSEKISYETCNAFTCLSAAAGMIRKRRKEIGK